MIEIWYQKVTHSEILLVIECVAFLLDKKGASCLLFFSCLSDLGLLTATCGLKGDGSMFESLQTMPCNTDKEHPLWIGDILPGTIDEIERLAKYRKCRLGIPTGFTDLDSILTGLHGGELIVVGARPAMGKTPFALNVVSHTAIQSGKSVALFCPELSRNQTALRILCSAARTDLQKVRNGEMTDEIRAALADSLPIVSSAPIYIDDTPYLTPSLLSSRCRELKKENKLDLIVIDYLGLMQADEGTGNREQSADIICHALKTIASELDVPVLLGSQLARPGKDRNDRYPILNDLKDPVLEREADVVLLLHRECYYDIKPEEHDTCDVIIAKHRDGPLGTVKLAWLPKCCSFANLPEK